MSFKAARGLPQSILPRRSGWEGYVKKLDKCPLTYSDAAAVVENGLRRACALMLYLYQDAAVVLCYKPRRLLLEWFIDRMIWERVTFLVVAMLAHSAVGK